LGFTEPYSVAEVVVIFDTESVIATGAEQRVVNIKSSLYTIPPILIAFILKW
jgi:hypothetical protein